jgi:DUF4097 and DUF4098 domain-containing protein YvlB
MVIGQGLLLITALAASLARASDTARGRFERTLTVSGPVDVEVTTGSGSITVHVGEDNTVRIIGNISVRDRRALAADEKIRRLEANPPIEQNGNMIRIGRIADSELRRHVGIGYALTVPATTRLRANSGSGNIEAAGLRAAVDVHTGSGEIDIEQAASDVRASTGSGSIHASGLAGAVQASTGSGSIVVEGTLGGTWHLETGSGSITARLPGNAAFELDAHTGSGGVHTSHPITLVGSFDRDALRGTVRGGGPKLIARTGSGGIRIE